MCAKERPLFPAPCLPQDPSEQKLLGIYPQRQDGLYLQRVRVPAGRLSLPQWSALCDAAEAVSARDALHLTTRQCIEVHGLTSEAVPVLQRLLHEAGLSSVGAAGDTLRAVTVDPLSGMAQGAWELMPLARATAEAIGSLPGIWELPRKFKISFSADQGARMRPWITDVGFVASPDGSLCAVVAGSLGANPGTGVAFPQARLTEADAVALSVAAVRLHELEGDRTNRRQARLRHVRERLGDAAFLARLTRLFDEERRRGWPAPAMVAAPAPAALHIRLNVPFGDLHIDVLREILGSLDDGSELRIGIEHDLHLFSGTSCELPGKAVAGPAGRLVACPGTALCSKAAAPTHEAAAALAKIAGERPDLLFAISGCPNSCAHAAVADVGLIGRMRRVGEERVACYTVFSGGQAGTGPELASQAGEPVALEDLAEKVRAILESRRG